MSKRLIQKRILAKNLRLEGKSYSQIKKELKVSKSTLSYWLRNHPLSKKQLDKLVYKNEKRIERFRNTMRLKRENRLSNVYKKEKHKILPLTDREAYLGGLFLYWGEGGKTARTRTAFSNTNPEMIKFVLYWLIKILNTPTEKIIVRLHLYKDMKIKKEIKFWSKAIKIPEKQFRKPYIKETTLKSLTYKGFGHGTCNLEIDNRDLKEKIMMGIKVISDKYSENSASW
ncbi:MAG: helix-turn-helix domain-containing protein [Patescibacteria group bacterium]|nr:helix-turn-helix domain-containing protein [Patescibacteria group bacterium]